MTIRSQQQDHRDKSKTSAFTLVELLVVIGIIALLISILLPALNRARESAITIACASNMRQAGIAIRMYQDEWKGWMPAPYHYGQVWQHALAPYIGGERPYDRIRCAAIEIEINGTSTLSFGLNCVLKVFNFTDPKKVDTLRNPASIILVTDSISRYPTLASNPYNAGFILMPRDDTPYILYSYGISDHRHQKRANVLYLDLHVAQDLVPTNDRSSAGNQHPWKGE